MKKQVLFVIIALFSVAVAVSFYLSATPVNVPDTGRSTPELPAEEKCQWIQYWDELDLTAVQRDYQPYTVAEMRGMWEVKLIAKYGGAERLKLVIGKVDDVYPQDTYLARMLELGSPFVDFSDYEDALTEQRTWLFSTRVYWDSMRAAERGAYLEQRGLPPGTGWETYEEMLLKNDVVNSVNFWRSKELDPYIKRDSQGVEE